MKVMKQIIIAAVAAVATLGFTSCGESAKLATEVEGTWSTAPSHLVDNTASSATTIDTYTFLRSDDKAAGGTVDITSLISTTAQINGTGAVIQPFSLSAASTATVSGTWQAVSDDAIDVSVDISTLKVNVDPDAVVLSSSILTGDNYNSVDSMKPALVSSIRAQVTQAITARYLSIGKIKDVKVKGDVMDWKVAGDNITLSRQN